MKKNLLFSTLLLAVIVLVNSAQAQTDNAASSTSVPTNLSAAAASSSQINLTWNAPADNAGISGYSVFRNGVQVASVLSNSYQDLGLLPSTTYNYTIVPIDATGTNRSFRSAAVAATTAVCTHGVNCYCDRVKNPADPIYDPNVLVCEDFEAPALHEDVGFGNGAPDYGPWYDNTGWTNNRGNNSYWSKHYGNGGYSALWPNGYPANPTLGTACNLGAGSWCTGTLAWDPTDRWQANNLFPCLSILRNGEFGADVAAITPPTGAAGGGSGVFDGQQCLGERVPQGLGHDASILGTATFGGPQRSFGVTEAIAYPTNGVSAGIWSDAWKHDEWHPTGGGAGGDGLFLFGFSGGLGTYTPFYGFMFFGPSETQSTCQAKLNAATVTAGNFSCTSVSLIWFADPSVYTQANDWPFGTWGCPRGYFQNMGLDNGAFSVKFTGPSGVEKTVIDISGMDLTGMQSSNGYDYLIWNDYFNGNYNNGFNVGTSQTTYRYQDNLHITKGAPCPCSQIGFTATGINEQQADTDLPFYIYPNPVAENLSLVLPKTNSKTEITIYNALGEELFNAATLTEKTELNISKLSSGVYLLEARRGNKISRQKFIKQ